MVRLKTIVVDTGLELSYVTDALGRVTHGKGRLEYKNSLHGGSSLEF